MVDRGVGQSFRPDLQESALLSIMLNDPHIWQVARLSDTLCLTLHRGYLFPHANPKTVA
jgi:hypothetical protein